MMFLPFGKGSIVHVYKAMKDANLSTPLTSISAIDFGKKPETIWWKYYINGLFFLVVYVFRY